MAEINTNPVSVTTPMVDTSSWNIPSMAPSHVDMQQPTSFTPEPVMPSINDRSGEVNAFLGSMRYDASTSIGSKSKESSWLSAIDPSQGKMKTTSEVSLMDTHELLNDGETWMPKYKSYLKGVDNDTRLSQQQTDWEKFSNPIKRFGSNTSKGLLDIGSFVYGIGAAATTGRFDALYDNSMSKYVDDLTAKTNFEYKNYYDQATKEQGLGLDLQTWDKVLGGAEFTARMFASEAVIAIASGGTSVPSSFARAGFKAGMALDKASDLAKTMSIGKKISKMMNISTAPERMAAEASNIAKGFERTLEANKMALSKGKWGDRLVQARFATTSPMYEAGFEAMHFRKEAEQNFQDYYRNKGVDPTPEEVNAFSEKLAGGSNAVFAANMAILSVSNLALFGDLVGVKNPLAKSVFSPSTFFKNNIYRSGTEKVIQKSAETGIEKSVYQAMKPAFWNKTAAYLSPIVKGMVIEGVYEEGSQGIASGTLKNYVASSYDPAAMKNTANYVDAFGSAFQDQFTTKEGTEEILIGALIGGLFGGVGGVRQQSREYSQQKNIANLQNKGTEFVENFESNAYTNNQLLSLFSGANRFQSLRDGVEKAQKNGDQLSEASLKAQSFISLLDDYHSVGKEAEFTKMFSSMFKGLNNESLSESTGLDISEVADFKQSQINEMNNMVDAYSTAREAGRFMFRPNTGGFSETEVDGKKVRVNSESMASAFAFASTMSFFNEKFAGETFDAFQTKLAQLNASPELIEKLGAVTVLKRLGAVESAKYTEFAREENQLKLKVGQITQKVNLLSQGEEKTNSAQQRTELAQQLIETQSKLTEVSAKKDSLWKSAVDNFYSTMGKSGYATQLDLSDFESQLKDIQDSLDGLQVKPEDKAVLENLLDQFNKSNTAYKSFTDLTQKLSDPKFAFKTYRGILAGTRAKMDTSLNEHTRDALLKLYNYDKMPYGAGKDQIEKTETVEKVTVNDPLNEESDLTNIDNLSIRKNALDQELVNLENQEYSEVLQTKIQKINSEIEDLKNQIENLESNTTTNLKTIIDTVKSKMGHVENQKLFDNFIKLLNDARNNMTPREIEVLINNIKYSDVAVVGGTTDLNRNTIERGDMDSAWMENPSNLEGDDFIEFQTALSRLFLWIQSDNQTRQQPETATGITKDRLNESMGTSSDPILIGDIVSRVLQGEDFQIDTSVENQEIQNLEQEIQDLEQSRKVDPVKVQNQKDIRKQNYTQYEYTTPKGEVLLGWLETRNTGKIFFVTEDGYFNYIGEARSTTIANLKDLREIQEEDVLIEDKEIYINGKIYKLGLKNPTLDQSISKDKSGNYQVTLQAGNGRMVTLTGSVADTIVYQHLLNKLEQDATEQQIRELREQADRDAKITKKYEEFISKTEDRDSRISKIEQERYNAQKEVDSQRLELESQIEEKESQIESQIQAEKIRIENDIASVNGEISTQEKIERFESEIDTLKESLIIENIENLPSIQRLLLLEKELEDLKSQKEEFNPEGTPLEQLGWVIKNIPGLDFENADGLAELKNPEQSDIDEYVELTEKRNKNSQQKKRTAELRDKLLPFNLAQGLDIDGLNIIDIINLYNQAKNKQVIQDTQENQITESDLQQVAKVVQDKSEIRSPKVGIVYDGAYMERSNNIEKVFHIRLETFLRKALEKGNKPRIVILNKSGRSNETPDEIIEVNESNISQLGAMYDNVENIKVDLNDDGLFLKKPKGETSFHVYGQGLLEIIDSKGYYIKGQSTGYIAIYDQKVDGSFGPKESEFIVSRDGVRLPFDKETLNTLEPGDTVTLEFDPLDDYNKKLSKKEYESKGNIYVRKNGKLVQILKASNDIKKSEKDAWSLLEATRKKVVKSNKPISVKIEKSYLGLPIIQLDSEMKAKEIKVDESKIVSYGYMDINGEIQGEAKSIKIDNTQYTDPLKESGKIAPIMVFKAYGKTIAFPLNLKPQGIDLSSDVDTIMNSDLSREQKMFQINSILEQNQMFTEDLALDSTNFDISKVKTALQEVYSKIDVTDQIQFKEADKYSYIDLRDPFMSSKLLFEFDKPDDVILDVGDSIIEVSIQDLGTLNGIGANAADSNKC